MLLGKFSTVMAPVAAKPAPKAQSGDSKKSEYDDKSKPSAIRFSNITAAKGKNLKK